MKILTDGLRFPEGPVAMPDGSIALVEIEAQRITSVAPDGSKSTIANVPGGPNGLALGPDGLFFLCNNGGFAFTENDGYLRPSGQATDYETGRIETVDPRTGGIKRLYDRVGEHRLKGPNDLMFDGQEGFWFSDLGKSRPRDRDRPENPLHTGPIVDRGDKR
jgi:gluconolactonase